MLPPKSRAQGAGWRARTAKGERKAKAFKRDWIPIQAAMPIHPGLKEACEILMGVEEPGGSSDAERVPCSTSNFDTLVARISAKNQNQE
jgi:hypothetical protein